MENGLLVSEPLLSSAKSPEIFAGLRKGMFVSIRFVDSNSPISAHSIRRCMNQSRQSATYLRHGATIKAHLDAPSRLPVDTNVKINSVCDICVLLAEKSLKQASNHCQFSVGFCFQLVACVDRGSHGHEGARPRDEESQQSQNMFHFAADKNRIGTVQTNVGNDPLHFFSTRDGGCSVERSIGSHIELGSRM